MLPLGYHKNEDEHVPFVKSILLYGPKGVGKTMLVNAVATELGASLYNLSPKNTAGQFVGKPAVAKMMYMVFRSARANAPAIVYIDDTEMIFAKKVPKDDTSDPKRIKKDIGKYLKLIQPSDRVIIIGSSSKPWDADLKSMVATYQKQIYVPRPEYGSRQTLWKDYVWRLGGGIGPASASRDIDFSTLARISDGYTGATVRSCYLVQLLIAATQMWNAAKAVLTDRRRKQFREKALTTSEFVAQLPRFEPVFKEQEDLFKVRDGLSMLRCVLDLAGKATAGVEAEAGIVCWRGRRRR